jgi:hypothetical protein
MILPREFTAAEIRVLQEFRRLGADSLDLAALAAIRHPAAPVSDPAEGLVRKGYVVPNDSGGFQLTEKAKVFLADEPKP